jgi:hypothetical protein
MEDVVEQMLKKALDSHRDGRTVTFLIRVDGADYDPSETGYRPYTEFVHARGAKHGSFYTAAVQGETNKDHQVVIPIKK